MFTMKDLQRTLDVLSGLITLIPNYLVKRFITFTLAPKPYLFRWGDAYDD